SLNYFWLTSGHLAEGREWLTRLLDALPIDGPKVERARGLHVAAVLAIMQGDYAAGERLSQDSLALFRETGDSARVARALGALAWLWIQQGNYPEAEALAREAMDSAQATDDRRLLLSSLSNLAVALHRQGHGAQARELFEQALAAAREPGRPWEIGLVLNE